IFYNLSANISFDDSKFGTNASFYVNWTGIQTNIFPSSNTTTCNTSSPNYVTIPIGSDTFFVCIMDLDENGKIDFIRWVQPYVNYSGTEHENTTYVLEASSNDIPSLSNISIYPASFVWGAHAAFSADISDTENDYVNVTLLVYYSGTGWVEKGTITNKTKVLFNISTDHTWVSANRYLFNYFDVNSTTGTALHSAQNTSEYTNIEVLKHNTASIYISGNNSVVSEGTTRHFLFFANDTSTGVPLNDTSVTSTLLFSNYTEYAEVGRTAPNSSGHCNFVTSSYVGYTAGVHNWTSEILESPFYYGSESGKFIITIRDNITAQSNITPEENTLPSDFELKWNVTGIRDILSNGNMDASYVVRWDGTQISSGTSANYSFNGSYAVVESPLIEHNITITLSKTYYDDLVFIKKYNVTSNISATPLEYDSLVYIDSTYIAGNESYNKTAVLKVNVTDESGAPMSSASVTFITPSGNCNAGVFEESAGIYRCDFVPTASLSAGNYSWYASIEKQNYFTKNSTSVNITIQGIALIFIGQDNTVVSRLSQSVFTSQVMDGTNNNISIAGLGIEWFVNGISHSNKTTGVLGNSSFEWTSDCSVLPKQHSIRALLKSMTSFYTIHSPDSVVQIGVLDNISVNITNIDPLKTYEQGDNINLSAYLNDTCGVPNASLSINTVWTISDTDDNISIESSGPTMWTIPPGFFGETTITARAKYAYYSSETDVEIILVQDALKIDFLSDGTSYQRTAAILSGSENFTLEARILTGNDNPVNESDLSGNWSRYLCRWYLNDTYAGNSSTNEDGVCLFNWSTSCSDVPGTHNIKAQLINLTGAPNYPIFVENDTGTAH
ncbi:MAG: carboxypeptidase regulatory-like domain-containing protein, partial [Candidatus Aenigmarchaeota archaeon]|nr:carboxypeptidase regulatory-like domain-containing protein [Candidatus Aenigmarchaeota archaeon]